MAIPKSDMRKGAEHGIAGARARLDAVLASPAALADGSDVLAAALTANDHGVAQREAVRLARLHPEVAEAWKGLEEAIKFYSFALLTDVADGAESDAAGDA